MQQGNTQFRIPDICHAMFWYYLSLCGLGLRILLNDFSQSQYCNSWKSIFEMRRSTFNYMFGRLLTCERKQFN